MVISLGNGVEVQFRDWNEGSGAVWMTVTCPDGTIGLTPEGARKLCVEIAERAFPFTDVETLVSRYPGGKVVACGRERE